VFFSDAKEIDPSDIEMKERLGAGQFGVSLLIHFSDSCSIYLLLFRFHQSNHALEIRISCSVFLPW